MLEPMSYLRKCNGCGLEIYKVEDLDKFVKSKGSVHGRRNWCKKCYSILSRRQRATQMGRLHKIRESMIARCYDERTNGYQYYGEKGIKVCQLWLDDKASFVNWALENGYAGGLQIDRIDSNEDYSPDNCRWVTVTQQQRNKSNTVTDHEAMTRICHRCGRKLPFSAFYKLKSDPAGITPKCIECYAKDYKDRKFKRG